MWKTVILSTLAILVVGLLVAGCFTSRAGYASAPYTVRSTDGPFEIRDYPSLRVAATTRKATRAAKTSQSQRGGMESECRSGGGVGVRGPG
jgi:hypothetical protein